MRRKPDRATAPRRRACSRVARRERNTSALVRARSGSAPQLCTLQHWTLPYQQTCVSGDASGAGREGQEHIILTAWSAERAWPAVHAPGCPGW
jgi:hypothetical protein